MDPCCTDPAQSHSGSLGSRRRVAGCDGCRTSTISLPKKQDSCCFTATTLRRKCKAQHSTPHTPSDEFQSYFSRQREGRVQANAGNHLDGIVPELPSSLCVLPPPPCFGEERLRNSSHSVCVLAQMFAVLSAARHVGANGTEITAR